jgi:hypothetical protein
MPQKSALVGIATIVLGLGVSAHAWVPTIETQVDGKVVTGKISSGEFRKMWTRCWGEIRGEYKDCTFMGASIDFVAGPTQPTHVETLESKTEPFESGTVTVNCEFL